jgi:altronate hydrolase
MSQDDSVKSGEATRAIVQALCLSARDSVAVLLADADPGDLVRIDDRQILAVDALPSGHKVALTTIRAGDTVLKYGESIGVALTSIKPGEHVHTHNLRSGRASVRQ